MTKEEIVRAYARESLGCPYIYGATGQPCTPSYRRARMEQYPSYSLTIRANCQQLKSYKTTCEGCRWARDGVGRLAYDCAQLTRCALAAAGIALPSGATSQYQADVWQEKGELQRMPAQRVCLVFRQEGRVMAHVGLYMGDETVIHASGHGTGVIRSKLAEGKWTHYALPAGLDEKEEENMEIYEVTGRQLALRDAPSLSGAVLTRLKTGTVVLGGASGTEGWLTVTANGLRGYCMAQYLRKRAAEEMPDTGDVLEHLYTAYRQLRAAIEMAGGSV